MKKTKTEFEGKKEIIKTIENFRKEKPLSIARNEACDIAKEVIESLNLITIQKTKPDPREEKVADS